MPHDYERVLSRWLGPLDERGRVSPSQRQKWFRRDDAFDALLREEFLEDHRAACAGEREAWRETARGRLAFVILLDQLSRNMFRGTPFMYASDGLSLRAAREAIEAGDEGELGLDERGFLYMPFMHSERLADQERCVELFSRFRDELEGSEREHVELSLRYAVQHRDIVARFGRFPHRNAILGRASTDEELAFLKEPGSSF